MPINPHSRVKVRKSDIRAESALSRFAAIRRREGGILEVLIITVVLGGRVTAFSMNSRAAWWSLWMEMDERMTAARRLV